MQIFLDYPWWIFFLGGILLVAVSFLFYRNDKKLAEFSFGTKLTLSVLRSFLLVIIFFLLLNPFFKTTISSTEKPILAIAVDNSESMRWVQDSTDLSILNQKVNQLINNFSDDYNVDFFSFGSEVNFNKNLLFNQKVTDVSELGEELITQYTNRNLAGLILISDGIYNRGLSANSALKPLNVPIFSVGVGDTATRKDLYISKITNNQIAYLDNQFPVEIAIGANFLNNAAFNLNIIHQNKVVYTEKITISDNNFFIKKNLLLTAKPKGLQQFKVELSAVDGEETLINNSNGFSIEVIDAQQKILLLADAPHPDIASLKSALGNNLNNKVDVALVSDKVFEINDYNLVILHQIPGMNNAQNWLGMLMKSQVPRFLIITPNTQFNNLQGLNLGMQVLPKNKSVQETFATVNNNFSAFSVNKEFLDISAKFPPLQTPFAEIKTSEAAEVLMFQKIGPVVTNQPLLAFTEISGLKSGFLIGEGIWRWRIESYLKYQNHKPFDQWMQKVVQFLAVKEDKSRFRLQFENSIFENENLVFKAELYDKTYTLTTEGEVTIEIADSTSKTYQFNFQKSNQDYRRDAGIFSPGNYSFIAKATLGDEVFEKKGNFVIKPLFLEKSNTKANYNVLANLADQSGGTFFSAQQIDELTDFLKGQNKAKPTIYYQDKFYEFINLKWLFALLLLFLSTEWFIRKFKGAY